MKAGDESQTIEFTYTDKKLTIEKDGVKEESDYTYKDNTVTVSIENQGMKFTREEEKK
jgi:very-short-patch-repair endonuclease